MKKVFTIKPVLIVLLAMISCTMKAETVEYTTGGFVYSLDTESLEASLCQYCGEDTEVVIPEFVIYEGKEYKVTWLRGYCFYYCSSLTSIKIPSSVTSLGDACFMGCSSLMSIEIPSSVTYLGWDCFCDCSSLTSIEISSSVTSLGWSCFEGCSSLTSIEIPSSVTSLGEGCFYGCSSLESIVVDANNPVYDSREGCNAIIERESNTIIAGCKSTRIPLSVTNLGEYCFGGCSSLTSIEIPSSVTSLGWRCFYGCSSLESIVVDANNPVYDSREGCNAIIERESNAMIAGCKGTRIPSSVTSLGLGCFYGCSSLTSIEIPSSVTNLGLGCFYGCSSLESIVVDANNPVYDSREGCNAIIERESNTMIAGCKSTWIPLSVNNLGEYCFGGCSSLTSIDLPLSVTSLGEGCFAYCSSLTSVEIPSSVTSLGYGCFFGCSSLKTVICKMESVIEIYSLFDYTIEDATLYVPKELLDTYKSTDPWKDFGTILPLTEEQVSVDETLDLGIALNTNNGNVVVSGLADGTQVSCYTVDGRMIGRASADGGTASFAAELNSIVIVKAGKKNFKVYVK